MKAKFEIKCKKLYYINIFINTFNITLYFSWLSSHYYNNNEHSFKKKSEF